MTYRQQLDKFYELERLNQLELLDIEVASEVDACFEDLEDSEFETICSIVSRAYLKSDEVSIYKIVEAVKTILENGKTIKDLSTMSAWDILEEVVW